MSLSYSTSHQNKKLVALLMLDKFQKFELLRDVKCKKQNAGSVYNHLDGGIELLMVLVP